MKGSAKNLYRLLFVLYGAALMWVLFYRNRYIHGMAYWDQVQQNLNLIPFHTIRLYWRLLTDPVRPILTRLAVYNLAGNILLFLPMGTFLPLLFPRLRSLPRTLLAAALMTLAAEVLQVFCLAGSGDIDDVILNLLGTALGYPLYHLLDPPKKNL